jgi:hypothetical protein
VREMDYAPSSSAAVKDERGLLPFPRMPLRRAQKICCSIIVNGPKIGQAVHYCNSFNAVLSHSRGITLLRKTDKLENMKQDRHCTYNLTMRRVRVTVVAVEKQHYCVF